MNLKERLVYCKKCENRKFDSAVGITCSLTGEKPAFENNCSNFIVDAKQEQKINNTTYIPEKVKAERSSAWVYIGVTLVVLKIIFRFLRD